MLSGKLIIIKDKEAFEQTGTLRFIGKPIDLAKKLKEQGFELLHIIDVDANKGLENNFDIYDKLTYRTHIEIECENEKFIERLLAINARAVVMLPTKLDLNKFKDKKRLLVGKIKNKYRGEVDSVYDLLIEDANLQVVKKYYKLKKRILVYKKDFVNGMEKLVFGVIE